MLPLIGIAKGAIKIGAKIFSKIKENKQRKFDKAVAKKAASDSSLQVFADSLRNAGVPLGNGGIAQSGNILAAFQDKKGDTVAPNVDLSSGSGEERKFDLMSFIKTPVGIVIGLIALYVVLKKTKVLK